MENNEEEIERENENTTQAELNDGERVLRLLVDPNDSLYLEDTETDQESEEDDEEVVLRSRPLQQEPSEPVPSTSGAGQPRLNNPIEKVVAQQESISQIDRRVMDKIQQLHQEMTDQGMLDAADLLQGCFSPDGSKDHDRATKTSSRPRSETIEQGQISDNLN